MLHLSGSINYTSDDNNYLWNMNYLQNTFFYRLQNIVKNIQSDQKENKSRVLLHLLFYRNVSLSLHSRFFVAYFAKNL
jgi:hypothetical protein